MANATVKVKGQENGQAEPKANGKFTAGTHAEALAELQAALKEAGMPFAWPDGRFGAPNAPRVKHAWYECVRTRPR